MGRHPFLPCITLFLIFGIIIGAEDSDLIPDFFSARLELIANVTLLVVGFLLGGTLRRNTLRQSGKKTLSISINAAIITTFTVWLAPDIVIGGDQYHHIF